MPISISSSCLTFYRPYIFGSLWLRPSPWLHNAYCSQNGLAMKNATQHHNITSCRRAGGRHDMPPPRPAREPRSGSLEPGRPSRARSANMRHAAGRPHTPPADRMNATDVRRQTASSLNAPPGQGHNDVDNDDRFLLRHVVVVDAWPITRGWVRIYSC